MVGVWTGVMVRAQKGVVMVRASHNNKLLLYLNKQYLACSRTVIYTNITIKKTTCAFVKLTLSPSIILCLQ